MKGHENVQLTIELLDTEEENSDEQGDSEVRRVLLFSLQSEELLKIIDIGMLIHD